MGENLPEVARKSTDVMVGFSSQQSFELAQRAAKLLSTSTLVPKEYQGNLSNCVIALNMASRIDAVKGNLRFESTPGNGTTVTIRTPIA